MPVPAAAAPAGAVPQRELPKRTLRSFFGHSPYERVLWIVLVAVVLGVAIAPLIYTVDAAFYRETRVGLSDERSLAAVLEVYFGAEYLGYLLNAVVLAVIVTVLSLVAGVAMAVLVARTDLPFKGVLDLLIIMPLFLSPFTGLIAWIALGSEKTGFVNVALAAAVRTLGFELPPLVNIWSYAGVVWVMFLFFAPFTYLFTIGSLRGMDSALEEAARTAGANAMQTLAKVTLPMSAPAIFASGLLIFILAAEMYTIPGIIGATAGFTTLPWKIYQDSTVFPVHRAHAAAAGTLLLWVTVFGVWVQGRMSRVAGRYVTVAGKGFRGKPLALGAWKWPALALVGFYILSADVLPFGALILSSFMKYSAPSLTQDILTLKHYHEIFTLQNVLDALWNTIWLALLAGIACVLIGFMISYTEVRRPSPSIRLLAFLGVLPVAVPGLVYGIGLLWAYIQTPLYGTAWVLLMAYVAKFLPYGIMVSRSGVMQIHPELEQSARLSGAGPLSSMAYITMPLMKATLIAILFFVMLQSIKELSASILLYTQRSQVLSVLTWHYMDAGNYQFAAAIGVVQTVIMIGLVLITRRIFRVQIEKTIAG